MTDKPSAEPDTDNYIAWVRWNGRTWVTCDSDADGAFKVYRRPLPDLVRDALLYEAVVFLRQYQEDCPTSGQEFVDGIDPLSNLIERIENNIPMADTDDAERIRKYAARLNTKRLGKV